MGWRGEFPDLIISCKLVTGQGKSLHLRHPSLPLKITPFALKDSSDV
jgi:hypothetical protein